MQSRYVLIWSSSSGFIHQEHFKYRDAKLKEVFAVDFPKLLKDSSIKPDQRLHGYYNVKGGHTEGLRSYHEFIRLFIKYKAVDRLSAEEALQQEKLAKYREAWKGRNRDYEESMTRLKTQADVQGISLNPENLLVQKCNYGCL